jgi:hypothetical protein
MTLEERFAQWDAAAARVKELEAEVAALREKVSTLQAGGIHHHYHYAPAPAWAPNIAPVNPPYWGPTCAAPAAPSATVVTGSALHTNFDFAEGGNGRGPGNGNFEIETDGSIVWNNSPGASASASGSTPTN